MTQQNTPSGEEKYIIPSHALPSLMNVEGAIGVFGGLLAGIYTFGAGSLITLGIAAASYYIGGRVGRMRMDYELGNGRTICAPSLLNKTMLAGGLLGAACAGILGAGLLAGAPVLASIAMVALAGGGALFGGLSDYYKQADDFSRAREQAQINQQKAAEKAKRKALEKSQIIKDQDLPEFNDMSQQSRTKAWAAQHASKPAGTDFRAQVSTPKPPDKSGIA